ncbi:MAG: hypothetical protein PHF17_06480 [Arcobacteraceae bacterium]|nr:hypothetical protein [Arcobacteraceae bacterium]
MKIALYIGVLCMGLFASEVNLPVELNGWKSLSYTSAAKSSDELPNALLKLNTASFVGLVNTPKIKYIVTPTNEGGTVSYGGIFQIEIKENGIYRVVLGNSSWIELVKDGKSAQSVAHNRGAENSGIRKMVDYALEIGTYTLQLSAGADSTTALLVTKIK